MLLRYNYTNSFIRSVAHPEVKSPLRRAIDQCIIFVSRPKIIGYQRQQIHYGIVLGKNPGAQAPSHHTSLKKDLVSDFEAHATIRNKKQSSSTRDLPQELVSTQSIMNTAEFDPKKDLSFAGRKFNGREEAPVPEIDMERIDGTSGLTAERLKYAHEGKQRVGKSHDMVLQNVKSGISVSTGAPTMESERSKRHHPKENKSKFMTLPLDERTTSSTLREPWQIQKAALSEKFKDGWNPRKRLSPDALAGIRAIHAQFPDQYPTGVLAEKFEVSPEAIRRILKSKWTPNQDETIDRQRRWISRGRKVWGRYAELGLKPPVRWRNLGIGQRGDSIKKRRKRYGAVPKITLRNADLEETGCEEGLLGNNLSGRIL